MKALNKLIFVLICAAGLVGCATTPYSGEGKLRSDQLLAQQLKLADEKASDSSRAPQIIYAGFASNSTSEAFRGDIDSVEKFLLRIDPKLIGFKLSHPASSKDQGLPYATYENMQEVMKKVSALARPQDKVVALFTTHGNKNVLSINFDKTDYPHLDSKAVNELMQGLRGKQVLLLLSACYSGSFLPAVAGPTRIVMTAAAADRNSFGCNFESQNTFFIDAFFTQQMQTQGSLQQLFQKGTTTILAKETSMKLLPSNPQISLGTAARQWFTAPVADWLKAVNHLPAASTQN